MLAFLRSVSRLLHTLKPGSTEWRSRALLSAQMGEIVPLFAGMVVGVEQLVGALGQGRAEELLVDGLNLRVLMAFAQGQAPVDLIQGLDAGVPDGVVGADGLSAAADTAAGAGHDLDEDIVGLAALYPADKLLGVLQTVGHGHLQGGAVEVNGGLLDGVDVAPYGVKLQPGQGLAG